MPLATARPSPEQSLSTLVWYPELLQGFFKDHSSGQCSYPLFFLAFLKDCFGRVVVLYETGIEITADEGFVADDVAPE